jgi:hypothetical protein
LASRSLQVRHELIGVIASALADVPSHDELALGFDGGPGPEIAPVRLTANGVRRVRLLRVAERPYFIALDAGSPHVPHLGVMEGCTGGAGVNQQLGNGIKRNVRYPRDRAHRGTLAEHRENLDSLFGGQAAHNLAIHGL